MSQRIAKINSLIQRALSDIILLEHNHPSFKLISILRVETTKDISQAKVYVSALQNEEDLTKYLTKLTPTLHKKLAKKIKLRKIPSLKFYIDQEGEYINHIHHILTKANKKQNN